MLADLQDGRCDALMDGTLRHVSRIAAIEAIGARWTRPSPTPLSRTFRRL
jgi:hypothetical protein